MNRIEKKFKELKKASKKAFIAFITCGDPSLKETEKIIASLESAGTDIVELGVPFSDPLADGPTIQLASERSLKRGTTLKKIISFVGNLRSKTQIPIALMTYYNPVLCYGVKKFCDDCIKSGVDGVIVPDLPIEEGRELTNQLNKRGLSSILFIAPTSTKQRKIATARLASGFIYYVSLTGVTGTRKKLSSHLIKDLRETKKITKNIPLCVGFGISDPSHIKQIKPHCDGVIVGSAIIKIIEKASAKKNLPREIKKFSAKLIKTAH